MSISPRNTQKEAPAPQNLGALSLIDAYDDFVLAKKSIMVVKSTLFVYKQTILRFIHWLEARGKHTVTEITNADVRAYLNGLVQDGDKPNYVNIHARNIRTFAKFLLEENYISVPIKFAMPPISKERPLVLSAEEVQKLFDACESLRDKALLLLFVDTGVRRNEFLQLNWGDVDLKSGVIMIRKGKGGKTRSVVMGVKTRRVLLAYKRTVSSLDSAPLIQTNQGRRFHDMGIRSCLKRLGEKSGVHVTPHALRRTFATLALRAGMNPLHLQGLMGHTTLEMTRRYIQMVDDDLVTAHEAHGPIDNFLK